MPTYKVHLSEFQERQHQRWYLQFRFAALLTSGALLLAAAALLIGYAHNMPS